MVFFKTMAAARRLWTEGYVFFLAYALWCPKIIWFCHMVIILTMTERGRHSGAITFERATDGLWLT